MIKKLINNVYSNTAHHPKSPLNSSFNSKILQYFGAYFFFFSCLIWATFYTLARLYPNIVGEDWRFLLFFSWLVNICLLHYYAIRFKKDFIDNNYNLQLIILIYYFLNTFIIYFISSEYNPYIIAIFIIFCLICILNYVTRNMKYKWVTFIPFLLWYDYEVYKAFPYILIFWAAGFTVIGLVYWYIKKRYSQQISLFIQNNTYLNDTKIINYHFKKEFARINTIGESSIVILIMMKLTSGTVWFSTFGGLLYYFLGIVIYIRGFIIAYCNPKVTSSPPQWITFLMASIGLGGGAAFWIRDAILNTDHPPNVYYYRDKLHKEAFKNVRPDHAAVKAARAWEQEFPHVPIPVTKTQTPFGEFDYVNTEATNKLLKDVNDFKKNPSRYECKMLVSELLNQPLDNIKSTKTIKK